MSLFSMLQSGWRVLRKDRLLTTLMLSAIVLVFHLKPTGSSLVSAVDWPTIAILSALLVLTRGLMVSGVFDAWGKSMLHHTAHLRQLALGLVLASILLSMLLTNDVALFVLVPFTLGLARLARLPTAELIVLEALAVNAGSLMSPIGNPQNILLWQQSGLSFIDFFLLMLPLGLITCLMLLLVTWWRMRPLPIAFKPGESKIATYPRLAWRCMTLLVLFLLTVEHKLPLVGLILVIALMGWRDWQLVVGAGWSLILVFVVMFVNVSLLSQLGGVDQILQWAGDASSMSALLIAALLSQLISNVPATMLLLESNPVSTALAFGVNAGGFGLALGSLANLIALRMHPEPGIWRMFHYYSVPFFFVSLLIASSLV